MRAVRSAPWVAGLAAVVVLAARPLPAQDATAVLRGVVMDTAGTRVPYALVRILPTGTERFTDARGAFVFTALSLGAYRVQARQVGFEPFESAVSLRAEGGALRIVLRPLAIRLDELTVTVPGRCTEPGPPDPGTAPALAAIFAQLRENARRFAVLADSYPFLYYIERTFTDLGEQGAVLWSATDTVEYRSDARVRYRPGDVIGWGVGPAGRRERVVRLPSLPDLADSAFIANHCFAFGGVREQDGQRLLRVAFRAADRLRTPDIDGEADLDLDSYQLRYLTIQLTRPGRAMPGLVSSSAAMTLMELYRNVLVPGTVRGTLVPTLTFSTSSPGRRISQYVEQQRLFRVHFLRTQPTDSTPSPQPSP